MGRYTGPKCRRCRREGMKLFLKGQRCYTAKCPIETGRPIPGMHGHGRRSKISDYGTQLREKQRLRRHYGLQEGQFRLIFDRASSGKGVTGEILLQMLEMRLDNLVYRLGLAPSRAAARQLVLHKHVTVDGRKASVPSMVLKEGSVIAVKERTKSQEYARQSLEIAANREMAAWLSLDKEKLTGQVVRMPQREEIAQGMNEQLVVELYSK